jgi:hypothetical protein
MCSSTSAERIGRAKLFHQTRDTDVSIVRSSSFN